MKPYTKTYLKHFGYDTGSFIPCEICGKTAKDLHHIEARGMGGSKTKDNIENIMALCREDHLAFGDKKQHKEYLKKIHKEKMGNG